MNEKIYRIMDSKVDALAAIHEVLALAETSIAIFDVSPVTMREREYGRPATIELLRQLMQKGLRIVHFEEILPTFNEIFIRTVQETPAP